GEVFEDDDDNVDRTGAQDEDDVLSDADAVEMDDAFIEALRIGALDRLATRAREDTLRSMQWTPVSSSFECDVPTYAGLGSEEARPTADLRAVCHSPLETFLFFMPKSLWVGINVETNRYGLQHVERRANQLLQLKAEDFAGVVATPQNSVQKRKRSAVRLTHVLDQAEDWVVVSGVQKRRQRSCKVCALLRTDSKKKSFATTFFCERCSIDNAKCWLCNKIRRQYKGVGKTCFEIWHDDFDGGLAIPPTLGKRVVLRRPGQTAGKRKKTRRDLQLRGEEDDDEDGGNESDE
ncbi:hypothetical protein BBJ28_00026469, partial [Nothophytophthora sp. Chile5]